MIRIHREGGLIVAGMMVILLALLVLSAIYLPGWVHWLDAPFALTIMVLVLRFFRVPRRRPYLDDATITAPCDGKVVAVEKVHQDEFMDQDTVQVSVFMSIHDVHVNYYPTGGTVEYLMYHPGKYLVARHPKSSELNERQSIGIVTPRGPVLVRQIAGYVARRVRCYARLNGPARQGQEMGFIKFGSRVDLFLPTATRILVEPGQRVTGGITPMARFS